MFEEFELELEEAALSFDTRGRTTFFSVPLPVVMPVELTGFAEAFTPLPGYHGSIVTVPLKTEMSIQPIITTLEHCDSAWGPLPLQSVIDRRSVQTLAELGVTES